MNPPNSVNARATVIVPTLNAGHCLRRLLSSVFSQKNVDVDEVVVVDSMSTDATCRIAGEFEKTRVVPISNFTHGRARNLGVSEASSEFVAFLSQDALPDGENWLHELVTPLVDEHVAATFSRQVPREDANPMERYFLRTHFFGGDQVVMQKDGEKPLAFQQEVFLSNVSAAARRETLLRFPFDEDLIMSEDQQFARDVLEAGYIVIYRPSSVVIHSHNYSISTVFQRYFDSVYSLRVIFDDHNFGASASIGARYVLKELGYIIRAYPLWLPYYFFYSCAKILATLLAHKAEMLPNWFLQRISLHSYYWKNMAGEEIEN